MDTGKPQKTARKPPEVNYDESKVPPFTLPDPLVFADGRQVRTSAEWPARRREILDIFAHEMYGVEPPPPEALVIELVEEGATFPVETILARGYAVMCCCYAQVSPDVENPSQHPEDPPDLAWTGVFSLWGGHNPEAKDGTTALGAWAWALSRGLDLAERIPEIDARRAVATGCSRLAKTALLACARDERFAVCVPCQTGGGGAPLAKRYFGENVATEMEMFPHWYCRAYGKYAGNEDEMPFDQHWLLASIAPRGLLVEGFNEPWFDTKGEFLACRAASPAWELLGKPGLPEGDFPADYDTSRIGPALGYVRRGGEHGISGYDWLWLLDFADGCFAARLPNQP